VVRQEKDTVAPEQKHGRYWKDRGAKKGGLEKTGTKPRVVMSIKDKTAGRQKNGLIFNDRTE